MKTFTSAIRRTACRTDNEDDHNIRKSTIILTTSKFDTAMHIREQTECRACGRIDEHARARFLKPPTSTRQSVCPS